MVSEKNKLMKGMFHIHTRYSFDSFLSPRAIIKYAISNNYNLVAITDHNSIRGAVEAKRCARNQSISVIIGAEYSTEKGDIIGLFLKEEIYSRKSEEVIKKIKEQGGIILLPHPCRNNKPDPQLIKNADIIEIYNARTSEDENMKAEKLARLNKKPMLVGSDAHFYSELGLTYVIFEYNNKDLKYMLLNSDRKLIKGNSKGYFVLLSQIIRAYKTKHPKILLKILEHYLAKPEGDTMNWKKGIQKLFDKIGYEVHKKGNKGKYTLCPPYDYSTYSPWFEDWFQKMYSKIMDHTVVKEDRCYIIYRFCQHCLHHEGDFAECGIYKGGTAFLIAYALKNNSIQNKHLHLFDTFAGMPSMANKDPSSHKKGDFGDVSLNTVKDYLQVFPFIVFHPGFIPETFEPVKDRKFAFAHIDVDLYQTAKDCCCFFYDRMVSGGIMIFDDYGFPGYEFAEKRAVDEFFSDKPETPISLHTGQCIVIKL